MYQRYANPLQLLDQCLQCGAFFDFVIKLDEIRADEQLWEFYLHKIDDKSFDDFKASLISPDQEVGDQQTIVSDSADMLGNFIPEEVVTDGAI